MRREEPIEFRGGEMQWSFFGLGGFGEDVERGFEDRTVTTTRTVIEDRIEFRPITRVHYGLFLDGPLVFLRPVTTTTLEPVIIPTQREITEKRKVQRPKEVRSVQGFGGAGIDAKYFLTRNFGLGLSGEWAFGSSDIGSLKATATVRFPKGSNAPYLYGGAGAAFGDDAKAIGVVGIGLEHRFSPRAGTFVDAGWMFSDQENAAVFRVGFSLIR